MKHFKLLLLLAFCFPFLGMDTMKETKQTEPQLVKIRKQAIRPTMEQLIQLKESELKRANSVLKQEIATFE